MKISSRRSPNAASQRRIDLHTDRAKSAAMRDAFPGVGVIHLHLGFTEPRRPPSPQVHSLYPSAHAFFQFACPCIDCDGAFDLGAVVAELVSGDTPLERAGHSVTGQNPCRGIHWRESNHSEPCRIELSFRVDVSFGP